VFTATWDQFDLERGIWTKPSAHTKQKREHRVPLSGAAMALLSEIRTEQRAGDRSQGNVIQLSAASDYVLPGRDRKKPLNDIKKFWATACREAKIADVRLHDLRHTFASVLASSGESLLIIGQLLGHTQPSTTARYAHLFDNPVREAANRAAAALTKSWPVPSHSA
jgi:integrase